MKNKITDSSYSLIDNQDCYSVKIKDNKYKGVIVTYGRVGLTVQEDGETAKLSFKYQIDDPAKFDRQDLEDDRNFNTYLGDVLSHIIQTAFDSGKYKIGSSPEKVIDVNTTTDDNPSEDRK